MLKIISKNNFFRLSYSTLLLLATFYAQANIRFIVMSDPQAWRFDSSSDPNSNNSQAPWEAKSRKVVESLNQLAVGERIDFGVINGDITEFGRQSTWNSYFNTYFKKLINFPTFIGLGNHDYQNNVNDCTGWGYPASYNACAMHMVYKLQEMFKSYKDVFPEKNFNMDISRIPLWKGSSSLAYSWDEGNLHFVQLNNYPTYQVLLDQWSSQWNFQVTSSLDFLEKDLKNAALAGKKTILNLHQVNFTSTPEEKERFKKTLQKYNVVAVFGGHDHSSYQTSINALYGNIPVFVSGALFNGEYYLVDADYAGLRIYLYQEVDGVPVFQREMGHVAM